MQQKRIPLLAGALVLLLGIAYVAGVFDSAPSTISVPALDIPGDEVSAIRLEGEVSASLSRETGSWRLVEPVIGPADTTTVSRLVDDLAGMSLASVVSTNAERHARYGVDASGTTVRLDWPEGSETLVLSSEGPDFASNYARVGDDVTVYATRSRVSLPTTLDRLRDKTVVSLDPALIVAASVSTPESSYELQYGEDGWTIAVDGTDPVPADSVSIAAWLRRYAPLRLDGFLDELTPDSVRASHRVSFTRFDGTRVGVAMEERDTNLAVVADGGSAVLRTFGSRLASLIESPETLTAGD